MIGRRSRRNHAPLAALAVVVILSAVLAFQCRVAPSGPPSECGGSECTVEVAGVSITATPAPADNFSFEGATQPPPVTALSAAVVDDACGDLLFGKDAHRRTPPASITKIVTAIVAVETTEPDEIVTVNIDNFFAGDGTVMGLETGMRMSMRDLLYGLLLPSGNDAAVAIARRVAGDVPAFVGRMNAKVRDLGLQDTHFTNPHGLDAAGHYSSAYDMAMLGRYAYKDPLIAEIVGTQQYQPNWDGPELWNGNLLLWLYPGADGMKTGWTEKAGQTMVATAQRDGHRLFVAVMGSQDRYTDVIRLLDWGFENVAGRPPGSCSAASASAGQ
jgi:serine-type D-Ala-D-Ala carboxypeptidase (penicillin-binding protein 5/6)